MPIQQVQMIQPEQKAITRRAHKGGGKLGQAVGGTAGAVVGGMAGMATGGPGGAVVGAVSGAQAGAALGNTVGEFFDKSRSASTAMQRREASLGPQVVHSEHSEMLKQSLLALKQTPPEIQAEYKAPLIKAYVTQVAMDNPNGGGQT